MGIGFEFEPPAWVAGLVFGGVGALGIAFGIAGVRQAIAVKRRGVRAEATVIGKRIWTRRSCGGRRSCPLRYIKVRWEDAAGRERVGEGIVNRIYDSTSEGDLVPIAYVPQQPTDDTDPSFAFVDEPSQVFGAMGCIVFSMLFLGVGVAVIVAK